MDATSTNLDADVTKEGLRSLSRRSRHVFAALLISVAACYGAVLLIAYLQVTAGSSLVPDMKALDSAFFGRGPAVSTIQRLLESSDGPMNRAGTMRPAFTEQSVGWESLTEHMSAGEKAKLAEERDGERLALLAWVRSGPSREAFEADTFRWDDAEADRPITLAYLADEPRENGHVKAVRIRSLVMDRCVTCHGEDGRHELARWIPLDSYENIERRCRPEAESVAGVPWIIAAVWGLLPVCLISAIAFSRSRSDPRMRRYVSALPLAGLVLAGGVWLLGRPASSAIYWFVGAAGIAVFGVLIQIVASVAELLSGQDRP